ncbi:hypothetical protein [Adhaeretor mobilis]|uniref:Ice-binding protein C-terminal domain-containing protein n=1 Tax=Adhaeretor mobilis TaxID=1930276 RepID=A0A517MT61_9BACT|nr:hypothetical protein [Adhaeretor mobilis]QDS98065.1 hypothetical protein HG15A2_13370 [Adhaeretor mobilis]
MQRLFLIASFVYLLAFTTNASAAIVPTHDATIVANGDAPDDGMNLTLDTSTNREWLDLTLSDGMSFNSVAAQLGPGAVFEGFQIASTPEAVQFLQNLGLSTTLFPGMTDLADGGTAAAAAIGLLGESGLVGGVSFSQATTSEAWPGPGNQRVIAIRNNGVTSTIQAGGVGSATAGAQIGHFLYRSTVPEPASVALFASCGFALLASRRRNPLS